MPFVSPLAEGARQDTHHLRFKDEIFADNECRDVIKIYVLHCNRRGTVINLPPVCVQAKASYEIVLLGNKNHYRLFRSDNR